MTTAELTKILVYVDPAKMAAARERSGLTRPEAAAAVGVTRQQVWYYETTDGAAKKPSADILARLCILYSCNVSDVVSDKVAPEENKS